MVTGLDVKSGYGRKKEEPYNSILPYLRSKKAAKKIEGNNTVRENTSESVESTEKAFKEVVHRIITGE